MTEGGFRGGNNCGTPSRWWIAFRGEVALPMPVCPSQGAKRLTMYGRPATFRHSSENHGAGMAKLVYATDLKSVGRNSPCRFESGSRHQ